MSPQLLTFDVNGVTSNPKSPSDPRSGNYDPHRLFDTHRPQQLVSSALSMSVHSVQVSTYTPKDTHTLTQEDRHYHKYTLSHRKTNDTLTNTHSHTGILTILQIHTLTKKY